MWWSGATQGNAVNHVYGQLKCYFEPAACGLMGIFQQDQESLGQQGYGGAEEHGSSSRPIGDENKAPDTAINSKAAKTLTRTVEF